MSDIFGYIFLVKMKQEAEIKEVFAVDTGEVLVRRSLAVLKAIALGSCIAVVAYDTKAKIAGLAHVMLPGYAPENASHKTRYAFEGISLMLDKMIESGSFFKDIEVCLVGAGNVLQKADDTICSSNIESVKTILAEKKIPLKASVLGGYTRKSVSIDVQTGYVFYTEGDSELMRLQRSPEMAMNNF